ncbi:MAG: hypothetical protein IJR89_08535, partial [Clostridia bacterium]|nr:hypothetical protein [Clostridia bacterium]
RNLSRVSPATLKKNLALINARPKKVLKFQKPVDLFNASIQNLLHFTLQFIVGFMAERGAPQSAFQAICR